MELSDLSALFGDPLGHVDASASAQETPEEREDTARPNIVHLGRLLTPAVPQIILPSPHHLSRPNSAIPPHDQRNPRTPGAPGGPPVGAGQQPRLGNRRRCRRGRHRFRPYGSVSPSLSLSLSLSLSFFHLCNLSYIPPFYFHCFNRFKSMQGRCSTISRTRSSSTLKMEIPIAMCPHRMLIW